MYERDYGQNVVNFIITKDTVKVPAQGAYEVSTKNKLILKLIQWLQKKKFITQLTMDRTDYVRYRIDFDDIMKLIDSQLNNMLQMGEQPRQIILGQDQYDKLGIELRQRKIDLMVRMPMCTERDLMHGYGELMYKNMIVTLNPYIDGVIIL